MRLTCSAGLNVKFSFASNTSYFEPGLVIANHHASYQRERILSLSKEGKNVFQIMLIVESQGRRTLITRHSQKVREADVPVFSALLWGLPL